MRRTILLLLVAFTLDAREVARVPMQMLGNRILLDVAVNDHPPSRFLLDTGAARTVVEKDYAAQRGIRATGKTQAMGAAAAISVGVAEDLVFSLGDIRLPASDVPLIPLGAINLRTGTPVQGVLGREAFSAYVIDVNYEGGTVAFHDKRSFTPPKDSISVPLHFTHGSIPQVDVFLTLPGGRTVGARLHLDTGAGPGLILTRGFARRHDIELPDAIDTAVGLGVGGGSSERTGRIDRLEFGGFTIDDPIVMLSNSTSGVLGQSDVDGILGGEILRRFHVQVDYGRKRLYLTKNTAFDEPVDVDMLGATLAARDATFRAIDGHPVTPKEMDAVRKLFRQPDRRYQLTIVREGKELVVPVTTRRFV